MTAAKQGGNVAAKKSHIGEIVVYIGLLGVAVIVWLKYGSKVKAAVVGGPKTSQAGGQTSGPYPTQASMRPNASTAPSSSNQSSAAKSPVKPPDTTSMPTESVAQAIMRGNTTIDPGLLAGIFNIQNYGNPYGDSREQTLADFGLSTTPEDTSLMELNDAGIQGLDTPRIGLFDFLDSGTSPQDWNSGFDSNSNYTDLGYIDPSQTSNFDFGGGGDYGGGGDNGGYDPSNDPTLENLDLYLSND